MYPVLILFWVAALVGGFLICTIVLPIVAWVRSRRIAGLERRVESLEAELRRLRRDLESQPKSLEAGTAQVPVAVPIVEALESSSGAELPTAPQAPPRTSSPSTRTVGRKASSGVNAAGIEAWIGQRGLGWAAALLLLFAVAFFLKLAFDNEWIGPTGQVGAGVVLACALCGGGLHYHRKGWRVFSQIMTGAGIALLYLVTFSTFGYFHLLGQASGSYFLVAVIVRNPLRFAHVYDAQAIAVMAVLGGLLTPVLLHTDIDLLRLLSSTSTCAAYQRRRLHSLAIVRSLALACSAVSLWLAPNTLFWAWHRIKLPSGKVGSHPLFFNLCSSSLPPCMLRGR